VMDITEIEKIRAVSRAATSEYGPWNNWYDRMCVKTVTRRAFNELPLGDLDELSAQIRDAAGDDADLPELEPTMTIEEANLSVAASAAVGGKLPDDGDPDDSVPETVETVIVNELDGEIVLDPPPEPEQESFAGMAEKAVRTRRTRETGE
jgi:recombinational DNA repair protein RecT